MKTKDWIIGVAALVLLGALTYVWLVPSGAKQVPSVSVATLDGGRIALDQFRGRPLLVTFWATTCPGCIKEIPHLIELHEEFGPRGLGIIAVAMEYDPPDQVRELIRRKGVPYQVALDDRGEAARGFGDVRLTPTSFLIDPKGRIVQHKLGELEMDRLRGRIVAMLGQG